MPQVKLSRRAQNDLPRLYDFLAKWDAKIAAEAIDTILASFEELRVPEAGTPVPEGKGLRKWVIDYGDSGSHSLVSL